MISRIITAVVLISLMVTVVGFILAPPKEKIVYKNVEVDPSITWGISKEGEFRMRYEDAFGESWEVCTPVKVEGKVVDVNCGSYLGKR